jgi:hypothetical protein
MRNIHEAEFPNSVEVVQKMLDEQSSEYVKLKVSHMGIMIFVRI